MEQSMDFCQGNKGIIISFRSSPFCNEKFQIKKVYTGLNGNGNFTGSLENDCLTHADR